MNYANKEMCKHQKQDNPQVFNSISNELITMYYHFNSIIISTSQFNKYNNFTIFIAKFHAFVIF